MADYALLRKLNLKNPWHLIAVGFGSGLSPKAPGTAGSFLAMFICMGLIMAPWYAALIAAIVFFFLGVKACNEATWYCRIFFSHVYLHGPHHGSLVCSSDRRNCILLFRR